MVHMTRNDSAWVNEMFSQRARDVTPAAARDAASVLYLPVSSDPEAASRCASILSAHERERSKRFVTKELKTHFEQRRAFRRYCGALALRSRSSLSRIIFEETENGRPYLRDRSDLWFSFSSCRLGFIGAWSSTHGLGVDLEDQPIDQEVAELAQMYFTESEARTVREQVPSPPNVPAALESQGSSAEIDRSGIIFWPRRVRVRARGELARR